MFKKKKANTYEFTDITIRLHDNNAIKLSSIIVDWKREKVVITIPTKEEDKVRCLLPGDSFYLTHTLEHRLEYK